MKKRMTIKYAIWTTEQEEGVLMDIWTLGDDGSWTWVTTERYRNVGSAMRRVDKMKLRCHVVRD